MFLDDFPKAASAAFKKKAGLQKPSDHRPASVGAQQQQYGHYTDADWEKLDRQAEQAASMIVSQ